MVEAKIKALRDELERHNYNYYVLRHRQYQTLSLIR